MRLEQYRKEQEKTQGEIANLIGVTQAAVSRYERGKQVPEPDVMSEIHRVTGGLVSANDFYGITEGASSGGEA